MGFKHYKIKFIIRVILIMTDLILFAFAIQQEQWYVTSMVTFVIAILLCFEFIRYLDKTQREIAVFLSSIKQRDFSNSYHHFNKKDDNDLNWVLHEIIREFKDIRLEKEIYFQNLELSFKHSQIAMFCFDDDGQIQIVNHRFKDLFKIQNFHSVEQLEDTHPTLFRLIQENNFKTNDIILIQIENNSRKFNILSSQFRIKQSDYTLISFNEVGAIIDRTELDSYKKLIKVMRHEIMNSITPITSLSTAMKKSLTDENGNPRPSIESEKLSDIYLSSDAIEKRSRALLKFVDVYRKLTRIPDPDFNHVNICSLLNHVTNLMKEELQKAGIELRLDCDEEISLVIDEEMIEQVIINLLKNAIDALEKTTQPSIRIVVTKYAFETEIVINDNGCGIAGEDLDNIFTPYYSTKHQGSGIGLSIVRQYLHLHKASIEVRSKLAEGTTVILKF